MRKVVLRALFSRAQVAKVNSFWFLNGYRRQSTTGSSVDDCEGKKSDFKPILMTGIQPTGFPHLGNYFGAIKQCQELQDSEKYAKLFISIADLHSITLPQNPDILRQNIMNSACALLACGLDRRDTILFQQSSIPQHAELAWILGCLTSMNRLGHLPQWKEKLESRDDVPLGLYSYPVLQAADVLLYKATEVPIGDDQVKHLELARYLAKTFNRTYTRVFPVPRNILGSQVRLKSLRNPLRKMSKSEKDSRGRIELFDSPDEIFEKLKKAVTDSEMGNMIGYDSVGRPGISNLIDIFAACEGVTPDQICSEYSHLDTVEFKKRVAESVIERFKPIRARMVDLKNNPQHVATILERSREIAQQVALETSSEIKKLVGFA